MRISDMMLYMVAGALFATVGWWSIPNTVWPVDKVSHTNEVMHIDGPPPPLNYILPHE